MADQKKSDRSSGLTPGEQHLAPAVQNTTTKTPSPADETPMPNHLNTDPDMPPVRTGRPDVPIAQVLTAGAGEHTPPDPDVYGPDGRLKETASTIDAT